MEAALAVVPDEREVKRQQALLKAIGFDRLPPEQREIALAIAKRYDLDPLLKHLVLIEGRVYITRDGLLWVAHRSGQLDGIEVIGEPAIVEIPEQGKFWRAQVSVYRKDMTRPFTYTGRYPVAGQNKRYGPEMAIKVGEVMALRRAFNVSAPVFEEQWERAVAPTPEPAPKLTLAEKAAAKVEALRAPTPAQIEDGDYTVQPDEAVVLGGSAADVVAASVETPPSTAPATQCEAFDHERGRCTREAGHDGTHRNRDRETWR